MTTWLAVHMESLTSRIQSLSKSFSLRKSQNTCSSPQRTSVEFKQMLCIVLTSSTSTWQLK